MIGEVPSILVKRDPSERPRFNLLVPTLKPEKVFGGVATALRVFQEITAELGDRFDIRIISTSDDINIEALGTIPAYNLLHIDNFQNTDRFVVVDGSGRQTGQMSLRQTDVFMATAWWTAIAAQKFREQQSAFFGMPNKFVYLIQDHEPDFYGWSSRYSLAKSTYADGDGTIAIINSEELYNYFNGRYKLPQRYVLPFSINSKLSNSLRNTKKERIIIVYGRPSTPRNAFEIAFEGIRNWQQLNPVEASRWRIISVGEVFDPHLISDVQNLEILGKLSLQDYGDLLSKSSIGISLMISPHPSYPPLEMAEAGVITITNSYDGKDLSKRHSNIISLDNLHGDAIAKAIEDIFTRAESMVGQPTMLTRVGSIHCDGVEFLASKVAADIVAMSRSSATLI